MKTVLALAILFILIGCSGIATKDQSKTILAACDTVDAALPLVAQGMKSGAIPSADWPKINQAIAFAKPICGAKPEPTTLTDVAMSELLNSSTIIAAGAAKVGH